MIKSVIISVMAFIMVMLGIMEIRHFRSHNATSLWETNHKMRRVKRRILGLFLLILILISFSMADIFRATFTAPLWNLAYLTSSLALVFVVFLLLIKDVLDTVKFAMRKQTEITADSIKQLQKSDLMKHKKDNQPEI
jgi:uncharacterized membrane protein